jgi:thioredoxin-like negative regulator of GroEL
MQPDLDAAAGENTGVDLVVIDASLDPERIAALNVLGTPTLIAVRDGVEVARFVGRRTRSELRELLSAVSSGDLAAVPTTAKGDRIVRSVAGAAVVAVGLALGPAWWLVAIGALGAGYANMPRSGRGRRDDRG